MDDQTKMYKDMYYSQKNLAYTFQSALRAIGMEIEDPNESPEEKIQKVKDICGYVGANPRVTTQDNG
jgi:hypothetical protein